MMFKVVTCLFIYHDLRLVALAAALCGLSCFAAVMLLCRAMATQGAARLTWLVTAGAAGGFGIWATHFVAMLAYDSGAVFGYEPIRTLSSLALAIAATTAATACATFLGKRAYLAAGLLFGLGISSMHFMGMAAIEFPGEIIFDRTLVVCAIALAVALAVPAFALTGARGSFKRGLVLPAAFLALGIVLMHFTAMGAVTVVAGLANMSPATLLSPTVMLITIAAVSLSLLTAGLSAALFAMRSENAVAAGEANFKRLVQGVTDYAIYMLDCDGRVANWNAGAERAKGYATKEIVGKHFSRFYPLEEREAGLPERSLKTALLKGKFEAEGWRVRKDGSRFWAHAVIDPIYDEEGSHIGFAKITKDQTEQMEIAAKLKAASDNLNVALENMANAICLYDANERLVLHNPRLKEIFDMPADLVLVGRRFREICELRARLGLELITDVDEFYAHNRRLITMSGGGEHIREISNGKTVRTIHRPIGDGSWVSTIEDITDRVQSENTITRLAKHDSLTGLPNRHQFEERLDAAMAASRGRGERLAAFCIDLDNFKDVNDTFGHAVGDQLLRTLAQRMEETCSLGEFVARYGGDEFVAFKTFKDGPELHEFASRLIFALTRKADLGTIELMPDASLGVAIYPTDAPDRERLQRRHGDVSLQKRHRSEDKLL